MHSNKIPKSIPVTTYKEMRKIVNWALQETKDRRIEIANAIVPPHFNLDSSPDAYNRIWKKFNALSGASISYDFEQKLRELYSCLFVKGQQLESSGEISRALDFYLLTVFNCCPVGALYYERPAIILEKQKRYILALTICDLGNRAYYMGNRKLIPEYTTRRQRLLSKLHRSDVVYEDGEYPVVLPPLPLPWERPVDLVTTSPALHTADLAASATRLGMWVRGEVKDDSFEAYFKKWKAENCDSNGNLIT